ncbi:MAG: hypothetical protein R3B38_00525 [Patescibacteria group bacterium]
MKFLFWIIGVILLGFFGYTFFLQTQSLKQADLPANTQSQNTPTTQTPVVEEEDTISNPPTSLELGGNQPTTYAGWEDFVSNALNISFQYPLNLKLDDGTKVYLESLSTDTLGSGRFQIVIKLSNSSTYYLRRDSQVPNQTTTQPIVSIQNPNKSSDYVYLMLQPNYPASITDILNTVKFENE